MYLANRIKFGKSLTKMCNVFDIDIEMNENLWEGDIQFWIQINILGR